MRNQNQRTCENNQIIKILWIWSWKNVKIKMDVKAEVLSKKVQDGWRFSKLDGEVCHGKLRSQHTFWRYDEDDLETNGKISRRIHLSHPREDEVIKSE